MPLAGSRRIASCRRRHAPEEAFGPPELLGHHCNWAARAYGNAVQDLRNGRSGTESIAEAEDKVRHTPFMRHWLRTIIAPVVLEAGTDTALGWLREADAFCSAAGERALQRRVRHALATIGAKVPRTSRNRPTALGQTRHHCPRDGNPPIGQHWTQQSRHRRSPVHLRPDRRVPRQQHAAEGRTEQSRTVAACERVRYLGLPLRDGSDAAETAAPPPYCQRTRRTSTRRRVRRDLGAPPSR